MKFRIQVPPQNIEGKINHNEASLWMGSCFTEHLGSKFHLAGMNAILNPFGTLFHPIPLFQNLLDILQDNPLQEDLFWKKDGVWVYGMYHSKMSHEDKEGLIELILSTRAQVKEHLSIAQHLFITLGTAWGYRFQEGQVVGNCHKQPSSVFQKQLTSPNAIVEVFTELQKELVKVNPELRYWLTVSPVKHLRDGISENTVSKGVCLYACELLKQQFEKVSYIPAFELVQEDLRDYRFYAADMTHPNEQAVEYVWRYFKENYLSTDCGEAFVLSEKITQLKKHKPRNKEGEEWRLLQNKITSLEEQYQKQFNLKNKA